MTLSNSFSGDEPRNLRRRTQSRGSALDECEYFPNLRLRRQLRYIKAVASLFAYSSDQMGGGGSGMMGYGSADQGNTRARRYSGKRMCWHEIHSARLYGYYAACSK